MFNRFSIVLPGFSRFVSPIGGTKLRVREEPEGDNIFFRRKLQGTVVLKKADFDLVYSIENSIDRCNEIGIRWEQAEAEAGPWIVFFDGVFSLSDCKVDLDNCKIDLTGVKPNDVYRVLLDNYTLPQNVLRVSNTVSATGRLTNNYSFDFREINIGEKDQQEDGDTFATFATIHNWVSGTATRRGVKNKIEIIYRLTTQRPLVGGVPVDLSSDGWQIVDTNATTAFYAKPPDIYEFEPYDIGSWGDWARIPDIQLVPKDSPYDPDEFVSVNDNGANSGACSGNGLRVRTYLDDQRCYDILWKFGTFTFTRNRRLLEVIRYVIRQISPSLEPATDEELSTFFTSDTNPVTNQINRVKQPLLAQITDLKTYRSSEAATKGMISFRDLMAELRAAFNVRWIVNPTTGKLQIEHVSFFASVGTFDLTDERFDAYTVGTSKYDYLKNKMPRFEKLVFAVAQTPEFEEATIEYFGACITKAEGEDTATYGTSRITTDLEGILIDSQSFPNDSFVLLTKEQDGSISQVPGLLGSGVYLNGYLSATRLLDSFYRHERVLPSGLMNGQNVVFDSIVRTKKQTNITVPLCGQTVNPLSRFITSLGEDGRAVAIEYDSAGNATFEIVHSGFTALNPSPLFEAQFTTQFTLQFNS